MDILDPGHRTYIAYLGLICALTFALAGCSSIKTTSPDGELTTRSIDEFRVYVEQVFRRQNRIGEVLIELETADGAVSESYMPDIALAEERMHDACESLNAAAIAVTEGRDVDLGLSMKIAKTVARCEHVTRELELGLKRLREQSFTANTIAL